MVNEGSSLVAGVCEISNFDLLKDLVEIIDSLPYANNQKIPDMG